MTRTHYIYVDYENLQEVDLSVIKGHPAKVILAIGPHVKTFPLALVEQLLKFSSKVRFLKSTTSGHNALDLLIGTDLGAQSVRDPDAAFHIISKDKDFDSLVKNLAQKNISLVRCVSFADLQLSPPMPEQVPGMAATNSVEECAARIAAAFAKKSENRPGSEVRLRGYIGNYFKQLQPADVDKVIATLKKVNKLEVDAKGKVTYPASKTIKTAAASK